ncbi:hypothetical protein Sthe_1977 [Sphaerobacter thermophilus DSM 20745]|uniref:Uncharacterized protein n=1 Tax=Sphaerobacter thermophilus (strain ATCC 49802 / DSM 20745 / KCCM 41009 / NCIMB 13125 / S 6022) TaxID=479434 RepID=D1C591_SPHTD|nr:hypothetical protein Sthe_1977 [Sphaerobacter thermophilus DSM 20745]
MIPSFIYVSYLSDPSIGSNPGGGQIQGLGNAKPSDDCAAAAGALPVS